MGLFSILSVIHCGDWHLCLSKENYFSQVFFSLFPKLGREDVAKIHKPLVSIVCSIWQPLSTLSECFRMAAKMHPCLSLQLQKAILAKDIASPVLVPFTELQVEMRWY